MRINRALIVTSALAAGLLMAATPGQASTEDNNGATQIARGDYAAAEAIIRHEQRLFPTDPDLMLNLAMVYARTGRLDEARRLYRAVLDRPAVPLLVGGDREQSSHAIASEALRQLNAVTITAR